MNWKDRRVQFAIGLAVVLVAAKWLFTGTPLFAIADLQAAPEEGETRTGSTIMAMLPLVVDLLIGGLVAIGAWVVNLGEWIGSRIQPAPTTLAESPLSDLDLKRNEVIDFAQAAADNDKDTLEALRVQIRKPHALAELSEAYNSGDTEAASRLKAELDAMVGAPVVATRKSRGGNG